MAFHLYDINEIYAESSSVQFIELHTNSSNQNFLQGHTITVTQGLTTHSYTFPSDLPDGSTANSFVLLATQAWANANPGITPNYIIPSGFLFLDGGHIDFGEGSDERDYPALPTNGSSLNRSGGDWVEASPTPMNFDPNSAPTVANALPDQGVDPGELYSYQVPSNTFNDADGDTLSYSAALSNGAALPSWLTFTSGNRTFSGTPGAGDVAYLNIRVTVSDGNGGSASDIFLLTVGDPNDAPVVNAPLADQNATAGQAYEFVVPATTFDDPDGDTLSYAATLGNGAALPAWLSFNAATRTFGGTPAADDAGTIELKVTVSDGNGGTASDIFALTVVVPVNQPPVVSAPIADQAGNVGESFLLVVPLATFTDVDGDALTYSAVLVGGAPLPAWLAFDAGTRTFSGTPAGADAGTLEIALTAADGISGSASDTFVLAIAGGSLLVGTDGADTLAGAGGEDTLQGLAGNDRLEGGPGDDVLDGGGDIDTAVYSGNRAAYALDAAQGTVSGPDGSDALDAIERLEFADINLAFDLGSGQAAGNTVRLIGAAFDTQNIIPEYVGIGLALFDAGLTLVQVAALALGTPLWLSIAGSTSNEAFVSTVYENVVGIAPSQAEQDFYVGLLAGSGGTLSQAELLVLAAVAEINAQNIDLAGLQQSGVEFV